MKHGKNMKNFFFFLLFQTMKQALEKKNDLTQNLKKKIPKNIGWRWLTETVH